MSENTHSPSTAPEQMFVSPRSAKTHQGKVFDTDIEYVRADIPAATIASQESRIESLTKALEYAHKGLDRIHDGLMDPTRPRQSVGEVCAHFLEASTSALAAKEGEA